MESSLALLSSWIVPELLEGSNTTIEVVMIDKSFI